MCVPPHTCTKMYTHTYLVLVFKVFWGQIVHVLVRCIRIFRGERDLRSSGVGSAV